MRRPYRLNKSIAIVSACGHSPAHSPMDLETIISRIAGEADTLLAGMTSMSEARPALRDYLKKKHPQLGVVETQRVIAGVFAILEEEGFFEASASGDSWDVGEVR